MNTNTGLRAVLSLGVGLAACLLMLACGDDKGDQKKTERGKGGGETPTMHADEVPGGTWSKVGCGGGNSKGHNVLDDIQAEAIQARDSNPPKLSQAMFDQIDALLLKCAKNENPYTGGDDAAHCNSVVAILALAEDEDDSKWNEVLQALMAHGH